MQVPKNKPSCETCGKELPLKKQWSFETAKRRFCNIFCFRRAQANATPESHLPKESFTLAQAIERASKAPPTPIEEEKVEVKKEKFDRDKKYLEFVRTFPCMICGQPSIAHHVETGGVGTKGSDYSCINLCDFHHVSGPDSIHNLGTKAFEAHFSISVTHQQMLLLREFIRRLKNVKTNKKSSR